MPGVFLNYFDTFFKGRQKIEFISYRSNKSTQNKKLINKIALFFDQEKKVHSYLLPFFRKPVEHW